MTGDQHSSSSNCWVTPQLLTIWVYFSLHLKNSAGTWSSKELQNCSNGCWPTCPAIFLWMHPANVTLSLIGWAHIQNDPCMPNWIFCPSNLFVLKHMGGQTDRQSHRLTDRRKRRHIGTLTNKQGMFNSLCTSDAIWQQISPSILVQLMACCFLDQAITEPKLKRICRIQLGPISQKVLKTSIQKMGLNITLFKIIVTPPRGQWVNKAGMCCFVINVNW